MINTYEELEQRMGDLEREVLEFRLIKKQFRENETKYRALIETIQAAIVVHDSETRIIACNKEAATLLGLTKDQMLGKISSDPSWKFLHADGSTMTIEEYPANLVLTEGQPLRNVVAGVWRSHPAHIHPGIFFLSQVHFFSLCHPFFHTSEFVTP